MLVCAAHVPRRCACARREPMNGLVVTHMAQIKSPARRRPKAASVTRLPVQHPHAPHCAQCKEPLPTFDNISLSLMGEDDGTRLMAITFHIRCRCGALWDLSKELYP
jgi:hypothetical protein